MPWDPVLMMSAPLAPLNQNVSARVYGSNVEQLQSITQPVFASTSSQLDWYRWAMLAAGFALAWIIIKK
jgi:hypothetical protein